MSNLPTKTMIKEWLYNQERIALENFVKAKRSEIRASLIGTDVEMKSIEWDEHVRKIKQLLNDVKESDKFMYRHFYYEPGEYLNATIEIQFNKKYRSEYKAIENEFFKIRKNLDIIKSPKKMLQFLESGGLKYPIDEEPNNNLCQEINASLYTPWLKNQLAESNK